MLIYALLAVSVLAADDEFKSIPPDQRVAYVNKLADRVFWPPPPVAMLDD